MEGNEAKYKASFFHGYKNVNTTIQIKSFLDCCPTGSQRFWGTVHCHLLFQIHKFWETNKKKKKRKRLGFSRCALESKTLQKQSIKTLKDSRSLGLIWQQTDSSGQSVFYNSAPMNARLFLSCLLPIQGFW